MNAASTAASERAGCLSDVAAVTTEGLLDYAEADWTVRAGSLEWTVERTITHMIGAVAKYTLYLAAAGDEFIGLAFTRYPGASQADLVASIVPVARGLGRVASRSGTDVRGFHAKGPFDASQFVSLACVELLVHTHDVVLGLGGSFNPPAEIAEAVLRWEYPEESGTSPGDAWERLIVATGRLSPPESKG